jgi:hypothetical protein
MARWRGMAIKSDDLFKKNSSYYVTPFI